SRTDPGRHSDSDTQTGSVIGTSAYMPPEQARGELDRVGRWSDVFSLGGVLCEILTGRPTYTGSRAVIRAHAELGLVDEAFARLDACGADPELVVISKRCLAKEPADRFADANAVAEAVAAHRAGVEKRLRAAEVRAAKRRGPVGVGRGRGCLVDGSTGDPQESRDRRQGERAEAGGGAGRVRPGCAKATGRGAGAEADGASTGPAPAVQVPRGRESAESSSCPGVQRPHTAPGRPSRPGEGGPGSRRATGRHPHEAVYPDYRTRRQVDVRHSEGPGDVPGGIPTAGVRLRTR